MVLAGLIADVAGTLDLRVHLDTFLNGAVKEQRRDFAQTQVYIVLWERIRPVSYRSIFMLRTKVRKYLAMYFRALVRCINMLR